MVSELLLEHEEMLVQGEKRQRETGYAQFKARVEDSLQEARRVTDGSQETLALVKRKKFVSLETPLQQEKIVEMCLDHEGDRVYVSYDLGVMVISLKLQEVSVLDRSD